MTLNVLSVNPVFPVECQVGLQLYDYDPSMGPKAPSAFPVGTTRLPVWVLRL